MIHSYAIAFGISVVLLIIMAYVTKKQDGNFYLLFSAFIMISNLGYMCLRYATDLSEGILANKVSYLGGSFLPFLMMLCIMQLCNIPIKPWLVIPSLIGCCTVLACACTVGFSSIFYKEVDLTCSDSGAYLTKVYGPGHTIHLIMLSIFTILSLGFVGFSIFRKRKVSYITSIALAVFEIVVVFIYFGQRKISESAELMPFAYIVFEIGMIILLGRIRLYDVSLNAAGTQERLREYGYVALDRKFNFLGANRTAKMYFPEFEQVRIDYNAAMESEAVKDLFINWLEEFRKSGQDSMVKYVSRNEKDLKCAAKYLYHNRNGKKIGYLIEIIDDTKQQEYIKLLNEYNVQLADAVDAANVANSAKSSFLANMSHEIRTPINAMLGMDTMILRECSQPEILEYAKDIQSAGNTLLDLINDILDFSKIESGKMELLYGNYELAKMLKDCTNVIVMRAKEKKLDFTMETDPTLPEVLYGDEVRVRQIITNLLSNAVKYTPEGSVHFKVGWDRLSQSEMILKVSVADTGIGIHPDNQEKLFESFERLDESQNRNIEGTGLGLAITLQMLKMMDGIISVESEYGKGSIFRVEIPQKIISEQPVGKITEAVPKYITNTAYKESFYVPEGKILVVDDVATNLKVMQGLLKKTRIQIDVVQSGEECLHMIQRNKYHIIFLDHLMPVMDGIETLQRLRQMSGHDNHDTPVIMLTANAVIGAREQYLEKGFYDYLTKPVDVLLLEEIILKYMPKPLILNREEYAKWQEENETIVQSSEESLRTQESFINQMKEKTENKGDIMAKSFLERVDFLNTANGMVYCCSDEEFYQEVVESYISGSKVDDLNECFAKEDWDNYRIHVHAVKSTSASIGADEVSANAKKLEFGVKEDNLDYVRENHAAFMVEYSELLEKLKAAVNG